MERRKHDIEKHLSGWKVPAMQSKEEAWNTLAAKLTNPPAPATRKLPLIIWAGTAAAAFLLIFFVLSELMVFSPAVTNTTDNKQLVWLPDSSHIGLKAYSEIRYRYGSKRLIKLIGEAFFEVKAGKPFQVEFPGGRLQVLGTSFNIRAYSEASGRIDCFSGTVRLSIKNREVILEKNQSLIFNGASLDGPFHFDPDQALSLPDNRYIWNNRPLREILILIGQREGLEIEASEAILNERFSGELNLSKPDQSLKILGTAMHFSWEIRDNKLHLFEKE